ncbi:MAG: phosphoenolpyruvate carboxykinase (GTP) [Actinobacteria bacterium]|nr:phosphoenolpyruvate carboxykinase (GTP) [Actinomycetota bacterium]
MTSTDQNKPKTSNQTVIDWVEKMARMTRPDSIYFCDGSEREKEQLTAQSFTTGELEPLNPQKLPGCVLHRTAPNDVARTEGLTFICTSVKEDVGPTNNWMSPPEAYKKLAAIFEGSMSGRTMYVIPFIMGVPGSSFSKIGIELTDSIYVVLNMRIMTRMGQVAWNELGDSSDFTRCLHSKADLNMERRFICHFPEDNTIWSVGSGYGGNVLLGKKCLALRVASHLSQREGWLAEHMLILGLEDRQGRITYIAAAFPSACGKTNLAMLIPPVTQPGYRVWTVGDDIAWMRIGPDGRLWALNPEAGFFGVAPGTSKQSNPNALKTVRKNTIFTNVVKTPEDMVWWEGLDGDTPAEGIDWRGKPWTPSSGHPGAHPNARFTAPAFQCPCISPEWENPQGVPISAIIFGGRRAHLAPLVYQSFNFQHGVFVGATMASERTAAQYGKLGEVRRDPMAMLPFCGYNMADYFQHWLSMGQKVSKAPLIFHVNWFRTDDKGEFIWPGFGENVRVLRWIAERCAGADRAQARQTPIGYIPSDGALDLSGLDIPQGTIEELLRIDTEAWLAEVAELRKFFFKFGARLPAEINAELDALEQRLRR